MFTSNDETGDLKLLDFGFSRTYLQGENIKYVAGTPYTMSPEVFTRQAGPPADVWAVGVCMYVLLYGRRPFSGKDRHEIERRVMVGEFVWQKELPGFAVGDDVKDLIVKCLASNPKQRITAAEALKHPFFSEPMRGPETPHRLDVLTQSKASLDEIGNAIDHLWTFAHLGRLRKTVLLAVSQSMTSREISNLNLVFEEMDITKDGTIGFMELTHVMRKHCDAANARAAKERSVFDDEPEPEIMMMPSEDELRQLFNELDQDGSGLIKYSEFIAACLEQNVAYSDGVIADAFKKMDLDNSGEITKDNLMSLMRTASGDAGMSDEQVEETVERMLSEGDIKGDGVISLEELQQVMRMPMPVHDRSSSLSDTSSARGSYDRSASTESLARMEFQQGGHGDNREAQGKSLKQLSSIQES
jgi:calcium-dependent protein kinase